MAVCLVELAEDAEPFQGGGLATEGPDMGGTWKTYADAEDTVPALPGTSPRSGHRLRRVLIAARFRASRPGRGCRIALHGSVSTPNLRPEYDRMSGLGNHIRSWVVCTECPT